MDVCREWCFVSWLTDLRIDVECELGEGHPGNHRYSTETDNKQNLTIEWDIGNPSGGVLSENTPIDPFRQGGIVVDNGTTSEDFTRQLEEALKVKSRELELVGR